MRESRLARLVVIVTVALWPAWSVPADRDTDTFPIKLAGSAMDHETGPPCAVIVSELPSSGVSTIVAGDTLIVPGAGGGGAGGFDGGGDADGPVAGGDVVAGTVVAGAEGGVVADGPVAGDDAGCPGGAGTATGWEVPAVGKPPPCPGALPGALLGARPGAGRAPGLAGPGALPPVAGVTAGELAAGPPPARSASPPGAWPPATTASTATAAATVVVPAAAATRCPREVPQGP
jgi:hypothetical protein